MLRDAFHDCQLCLLSKAGVVKLRITEPRSDQFVVYITASQMAFIRVHSICHYENVCDKLQLSEGFHFASEITKSIPNTIEIKGNEKKIVCLTQLHEVVSERCRMCLRQASDSKSMGEFLISSSNDFHFVYVLRSYRRKDSIAEACTVSKNCENVLTNVYSDHLCNAVHNMGVLNHYESRGITVTNVDVDAHNQNEPSVHCVVATSKKKSSNKRMDYHESIKDCMMCLAGQTHSFVHWMRITAARRRKTYLMFASKNHINDQRPYNCGTCTIKKVATEQCYTGYDIQFDTTPIVDQISVYMDPSTRSNSPLERISSCIIIEYEPEFEGSCTSCLWSFLSPKGAIRMSNIESNAFVNLRIHPMHLASCITARDNPACMRISYVDYWICLGHEQQTQGYHQMRAVSVTSRKDYRSSSLISKQHKMGGRNMRTETRLLSATFGGRMDSLQTVLKELDRELMDRSPSHHRRSSKAATGSSSNLNDVKPSHNIMVLKYSDNKCLMCLALKMNVLAISTVKQLMWVKKEIEETMRCDCAWTHSGTLLFVNLGSMRPIPVNHLQRYFLTAIVNSI